MDIWQFFVLLWHAPLIMQVAFIGGVALILFGLTAFLPRRHKNYERIMRQEIRRRLR